MTTVGSSSPRRSSRRVRPPVPSRTRTSPIGTRPGSSGSGCWSSAPAPVEAFKSRGADFVVADTLEELVAMMNKLTDAPLLKPEVIRAQIGHEICRDNQPIRERRSGAGDPELATLPRRPDRPHRRTAPHPRPCGRTADRRQAAHPDPKDLGWHPDRSVFAGSRRQRTADPRSVRRR